MRRAPLGPLAGVAGVAAGLAATGLAAGVAAERYVVGRARLAPDLTADEPLGRLAGRSRTVPATDGVPLYVEEAGGGPLTVVLVHGYVVDRRCWHYQWRDLRAAARVVCFDQRAHGRSGRGDRSAATIDQLGRDLHSVLAAVAPTGPVVLVGHSMGGMSIMALADAHPELFGPRVVAVGLISTSTGRLGEGVLGLPGLVSRAVRVVSPRVASVVQRRPEVFERGRHLSADIAFLLTRRYSFGAGGSPALVAFVEQMVDGVRVDAMTEFVITLLEHEKLSAVRVLRDLPSLVLVGERDRQTPPEHSRAIAAELPRACLVVLPGAGHMVMLEQPDEVTAQLRALLTLAAA